MIFLSSEPPSVQTLAASYPPRADASAAAGAAAADSASSAPAAQAQRPRSLVHHEQDGVSIVFDPPLRAEPLPPKGRLFVAESQLIWFDAATSTNISIDYPTIVIHAISRTGDAVVKSPSIYCQLSTSSFVDREGRHVESAPRANADPEGGDDLEEVACELRIVPDDPTSLDPIYQAMTDCAAMHPDPDADEDMDDYEDGDDDEDGRFEDSEWVFDPETAESLEFSEAGQAALDHIESVFGVRTRPEIQPETAPAATSGAGVSNHTGANGNRTTAAGGQFDDADEEER
ncbi:hypothetical protein HK105_204499 [Polyrhizophydium stewartii]|uniref:Regulator of volume decrease after cellular swelling-domain-containing protein n=1 Tax=Polyrhizophydium stewartii TaxID=2732419 RepID=A0ABR4N964_9FUNG|nr:hypothetical protein HK105_003326 [Polyrhizophydium stewartii]